MKHFTLITLFVFAMLVTTADENSDSSGGLQLTAEQTEALIERAMEESAAEDDDCSNQKLTACVGISRSVCEKLREAVVSSCTIPLARKILSGDGELTDNIEFEHGKCTLELGESEFSIEPEKYMSCMPTGTYKDPGKISKWLENR